MLRITKAAKTAFTILMPLLALFALEQNAAAAPPSGPTPTYSINFGSANIGGTPATQTATVVFSSSITLASTPYVVLTRGAQNLDFQAAATQPSSNACLGGQAYSSGGYCQVNLTFSPTKPDQRIGGLQLMGSGGTPIATVHLIGTGIGPQVVFPSNSAVTQLATSVSFAAPYGLAVDGSGNLFVADSNHNSVKKIAAVNGSVSSSSTSVPVGSGFSAPHGVAVDGSGNVFVADTNNNAVKEIVAVNGSVSSASAIIALGSGFSAPRSVAVDGSGNVFVADTSHNAVKEILAANGAVNANSTVVTLGTSFSSPNAVAVDSSGNVFVGTAPNIINNIPAANTVQEIVAVSGTVTASSTVINIGSGMFLAYSLAVDGNGNVFVADPTQNIVEEIVAVNGVVSSTSIVTTVASYNVVSGLALDGNGNIFVADRYDSVIGEVNFSTPAPLAFPITNSGAQSTAQSVTIQNTGNATLNQTSLAVSTNFAQIAGTGTPADCPSSTGTLAVGATCNISLIFAPTTGGDLTGTAALTNNAPNSPQAIQLSGTGVAVASLVSFTPNSAPTGSSNLSITIVGQSTHFVQGTTNINFGSGIQINSVAVTDATHATVNITMPSFVPAGTLLPIEAKTGSEDIVLQNAFTVTAAPSLVSVTPISATAGSQNFTITVVGQDTHFVQGTTYIGFGAGVVTGGPPSVTVTDATHATATVSIPAAVAPSTNDVTVTTGSEVVTLTGGFSITAPTSISFPSASIGSPTTQTVTLTIPTATTLASTPFVVLTKGAQNLDFQAAATQPSTNACVGGQSYTAGSYCTVNVTFSPAAPYQRIGAVQLMGSNGLPISTVNLTGFGVAPLVSFPSNAAITTLAANGGLGGPAGVAVDGSGNVFVADSNNNTVNEIVAVNGTVNANSAVVPVGSGFNNPHGVAVDGAGNVFVADTINNAVEEIVAVNGTVNASSAVVTIGSGFNGPLGVAVDGGGNVFVADTGNGAVEKVVAVNGLVNANSTVVPVGNDIINPRGVAVDGSGNIFVAGGNFTSGSVVDEIVAVNGTVNTSSTVVQLASGYSFQYLNGVAVDGSGNVFAATQFGNVVYKIVAVNGMVNASSTVVTIGYSSFQNPAGVTADSRGNIFVADTGNSVVEEIDFADPNPLAFPTTNTGAQSPVQSLTVQNIGNAPLSQISLVASTNFTQIPGSGTPADCPAATGTLAAGATCNISLVFAPTSAGSLTGTSTLTNNNLNVSGSTEAISLSGTGVLVNYNINVSTVPSGLSFTLGNTAGNAPQSISLPYGTKTTLSTQATQNGTTGTQYTFNGWSDGTTSPGDSITVTGNASYTASFNTLFNLTVSPSSTAGGGVTGAGYFLSGSTVTIAATPNPGYVFTGWTGATTSSSAITTVFMTGPLTATANFQPQSAGSLKFNTGPESTTINTAFTNALSVTLKDPNGNLVPNAYVLFSAPTSGASGTFGNNGNNITVQTNASGIATTTFTANSTAGAYSVTVTSGALTASLTLTNTPGPVTTVSANNAPQSTTISTAFTTPLAVTLKDAGGNVVPNTSVVFTAPATGASGTFSNSTATITVQTNASGIASATFTANATAGGPYNVTATVGSVSTTLSLTNTPGSAASITPNTGSTPQSANANAAFASSLAVTVKDGGGNLLSGVTVTFTPPGSGSSAILGAPTAVTNSSGIASVTATANATAGGPYNVSASANGASTSFSLSNNSLSQNISFGTVPTQTVGSPLVLTASATSSLAVTYSSSTTSVCTISAGTVSFPVQGQCSITASQTGNATYSAATPVTQTFTVSPNTPTSSSIQAVSIGGNSELITWTTDMASTSQVNYGPTSSYGSSSPLDSNLVTFHSVTLTALSPNTTYNFDVVSTNSINGTTTSNNASFKTTPYVGYVAFWGVNNSGVTISWSSDVTATGFVAYGTTPALGQSTPVQSSLTNGHGLVLTGLYSGTTYYFRCESTDANGSTGASTIYRFTTSGAPASPSPIISNVNVSNITTTSATVNWTTDLDSTTQVFYGLTPAYGSSSLLSSSLVTSHSVILNGLIPGTTYNFETTSGNSSGTASGTSSNITFTTVAVVSTPPVITSVQSTVTSSSATITWTTDKPATSSVNYGTRSTTSDGNYVTSHSVTLTGLTPGTLYNFSVVSTNTAALTTTSPNSTFTTTASNATAPFVGYVAAWGINGSGATVTWSTDLPANTELVYGTSNPPGSASPVQTDLTASHGVTLTGLASGTTYYFIAESTAANGATGYSSVLSFTTTGAPSAPAPNITNIQTQVTDNSATISWTTDEAASSQVNYGVTATYSASSTQNPVLATSHSVTLTGLMPGTTYNFDVVSSNANGLSSTSTNATFQTSGSAPGPVITSVAASSITSSTALITWTTDQASSSLVKYGNNQTASGTGSVTSHSVMLTGLTPNTPYSFTVMSANAASVSTTSNPVTFTTSSASGSGPVLSYLAFWGVTSSGVTISWSTDVPSNTAVNYGTTNSLGTTTPVQTALTNSHGVVLTGLQPGTNYYFQAQSADVNGNPGYSATIYTFTTLGSSGPGISNVTLTPGSGNAATVTWTTSTPTYSYVQYGTSPGNYNRYSAQTSLTTSPRTTLGYVPTGTIHYQLVSTDVNGNQVISPDAAFVEP